LDTNVQIEHRPITQHGMTGMKTASKGPNRKIADRNYYENELKGKLIEIVKEIDSMKSKMKNHGADKIESAELEKERNSLMNEVREFEGQLADYNLALDKMRSGADVLNLQQTAMDIQRKNDQEKMRIDAIFLERKNLESQIQETEQSVALIHDEMLQTQINDDPAGASAFNQIYGEYERTEAMISEKEKRLMDIQRKYHEIRESLNSSDYSYHLKAMELQKRCHQLTQHKAELEQETNGSMDPEQIKQKILEKVKSDNLVLQHTMDAINAMDDKVEELQSGVHQKEKDLESMKKYTEQSHKYEQLFDRDRKMQIFIDQYESNQSAIREEIEALREDNYGLLVHISESLEGDGVNRSELAMKEMRSDIHFKEQQKREAQDTLIYSEKELEKRKAELDKINNLDSKISIELGNMDEEERSMQQEMDGFMTHEEIQAEYKRRKQELFRMKMEAQQRKEVMEKKVLDMAQQSDVVSRKLGENAYHKELLEMETKISKLSQNIFSVEDSIAEFKREGQYDTIAGQVLEMQATINTLLLQEMALEI